MRDDGVVMTNYARIVEFGKHCVSCKGIRACCVVRHRRMLETGAHTTSCPFGNSEYLPRVEAALT